ncbi:MAG: uroporphyrinogen decarboxylase [Calditrichaeota bacterium]|nr:uroporphyrinogen decarboxylase [Calditrichota bacterium]
MKPEERHLFIEACFRRPVERTPVWMMRQAGRYLPEYRAIREKYDFITMYKTPELVAEVTLQPVHRLQVDAAILFSDILVIPEAMGMALEFRERQGPVLLEPIRQVGQIPSLKPVEPETDLNFVLEGIRLVRRELEGRVPLIGFSGAPWTLATYMIEGGASRNFGHIKRWRFGQPDALHQLLERISDAVVAYCRAQIAAGAQAIQLFDSWAGILDAAGFEAFALRYVRKIIQEIRTPGVPIIYFARGVGAWLPRLATCGADVVGLDWQVDLRTARQILGPRMALQGNLDPTALYAPPPVIRQLVREMLKRYGAGSGHVANLGHGILPDVPVEHARAFIEAVKTESPVFHNTSETERLP